MPERITFSGGQTENVYPVPQLMLTDLEARPEFKTAPDDPPNVVIAKGEALADARERASLVHAFHDTVVPKGWGFPKAALDAGMLPSAGEDGRLYDYIKYGLLVTARDILAAQRVMQGLTAEEVAAAEATFCSRRGCIFRRSS